MAGLRMKKEKRCAAAAAFNCKYRSQKALFQNVPLAVTNYPYFFTERTYVGEFKNRRVLIADECHTLEKQVLGFVEISINSEILERVDAPLAPGAHAERHLRFRGLAGAEIPAGDRQTDRGAQRPTGEFVNRKF
jgi:Rad3-related DNA helicase